MTGAALPENTGVVFSFDAVAIDESQLAARKLAYDGNVN
jgi:hypothetical protein